MRIPRFVGQAFEPDGSGLSGCPPDRTPRSTVRPRSAKPSAWRIRQASSAMACSSAAKACSNMLVTALKASPAQRGLRVSRTDSFPQLPAVDGNLFINLEAQLHLAAVDLQHRDFERALEAEGAPDHHGFPAFPRQDQHDRT